MNDSGEKTPAMSGRDYQGLENKERFVGGGKRIEDRCLTFRSKGGSGS